MFQQSARILIIEDDDSIRGLLTDALTLEGYAVQTADDGAVALLLLEQSPYDLILLDMHLPVMDGWEFLAAYGQFPMPCAPVVVLSADATMQAQLAAVRVAGFVRKPFDLDALFAAVAGQLQWRKVFVPD